MNITSYSKKVPVYFVVINGLEFQYNTIVELVEALEESNYIDTILIYDRNLEYVLSSLGVITRTARGGCYKTDKFQAFADTIMGLDHFPPRD